MHDCAQDQWKDQKGCFIKINTVYDNDFRKIAKKSERALLRKNGNYYLCKIKDAHVYEQILQIYLPNVTDNILKEC